MIPYMVSLCSHAITKSMTDEIMATTKPIDNTTSSASTVNQFLQSGMHVGLPLLLSRKNLSAHLNSLWSPGIEVFIQPRPDAFLSFRPSVNNFDSYTLIP